MKNYFNLLQAVIIVLIIALNSYAIADGLRVSSASGILLSLGSLVFLGYCVHLVQKLKKLDAEDDYEDK